MKAEKAKQQDNNESTVDKCQIGKPIQVENLRSIESIIEEEFKVAIEGVIFDINLKRIKKRTSYCRTQSYRLYGFSSFKNVYT